VKRSRPSLGSANGAGRARRQSEAWFRLLADTVPVMVWTSGTDMLCDFFNEPWLAFTGRTLEQENGNGWSQGVHPDDLAACLQTYSASFQARRPFTMEYRLRRADGEYRWLLDHGVPRYTPDGRFAGYIGSCIDLTERRQAEERFRAVVEAAPHAMIMADAAGTITLANAQAAAVFGYRPPELVGRRVEALVPERLHAPYARERDRYLAEPKPRVMGAGRELYGRRKDGREVPLEIDLNPVRTAEGLFVLASIVDLTERRQAELEAARQREELAHLSRVLVAGELSGALAHELNQPLTAILTNAQAAQRLLAQGAAEPAELQDILTDTVEASHRATQVIRRLRLLLKKGEVQRLPLEVNEVVGNALKLMRSDLARRRVSVEVDLARPLPAVVGDAVQLQQVLLNLLVNGCEAMAGVEGPERRLRVRTERTDAEGVRVSVVDRGGGIPADQQERVFEPFFTTKGQGMGLGLAICRTIIAAHGGKLWATANPEGGATFQFTLPPSGGA
jgi:two-component system, LuxR family, sensor kinase FixL